MDFLFQAFVYAAALLLVLALLGDGKAQNASGSAVAEEEEPAAPPAPAAIASSAQEPEVAAIPAAREVKAPRRMRQHKAIPAAQRLVTASQWARRKPSNFDDLLAIAGSPAPDAERILRSLPYRQLYALGCLEGLSSTRKADALIAALTPML